MTSTIYMPAWWRAACPLVVHSLMKRMNAKHIQVDTNAVLAVLKVALHIPLLAAPGLSVVASSTVKSRWQM